MKVTKSKTFKRICQTAPDLQLCPLQGPPGKSRRADLQGKCLLVKSRGL